MARILTQCNTSDLKAIIQLVASQEKEELPDSLKNRLTTAAASVLIHAGLTFEEIYTIKRIMLWDNGYWSYKFHRIPEAEKVRIKLSSPTVRKLITEKLTQIGTKL